MILIYGFRNSIGHYIIDIQGHISSSFAFVEPRGYIHMSNGLTMRFEFFEYHPDKISSLYSTGFSEDEIDEELKYIYPDYREIIDYGTRFYPFFNPYDIEFEIKDDHHPSKSQIIKLDDDSIEWVVGSTKPFAF